MSTPTFLFALLALCAACYTVFLRPLPHPYVCRSRVRTHGGRAAWQLERKETPQKRDKRKDRETDEG